MRLKKKILLVILNETLHVHVPAIHVLSFPNKVNFKNSKNIERKADIRGSPTPYNNLETSYTCLVLPLPS